MLQLRKYDSSHVSSASQDIFLQSGISVLEDNMISRLTVPRSPTGFHKTHVKGEDRCAIPASRTAY